MNEADNFSNYECAIKLLRVESLYSDTDRLNWMISNKATVHLHGGGFFIRGSSGIAMSSSYETAREAIDDAMRGRK